MTTLFLQLPFELAIKVIKHLKLPCDALNLDGTSIHVDGRYNSDNEVDDEDLNCIRLCKGYSRDHRPDPNQAILLLMTETQQPTAKAGGLVLRTESPDTRQRRVDVCAEHGT